MGITWGLITWDYSEQRFGTGLFPIICCILLHVIFKTSNRKGQESRMFFWHHIWLKNLFIIFWFSIFPGLFILNKKSCVLRVESVTSNKISISMKCFLFFYIFQVFHFINLNNQIRLFFFHIYNFLELFWVFLPNSKRCWHLTNVNHFTRPVCLNFNSFYSSRNSEIFIYFTI